MASSLRQKASVSTLFHPSISACVSGEGPDRTAGPGSADSRGASQAAALLGCAWGSPISGRHAGALQSKVSNVVSGVGQLPVGMQSTKTAVSGKGCDHIVRRALCSCLGTSTHSLKQAMDIRPHAAGCSAAAGIGSPSQHVYFCLQEQGARPLLREPAAILQINIGLYCNQVPVKCCSLGQGCQKFGF